MQSIKLSSYIEYLKFCLTLAGCVYFFLKHFKNFLQKTENMESKNSDEIPSPQQNSESSQKPKIRFMKSNNVQITESSMHPVDDNHMYIKKSYFDIRDHHEEMMVKTNDKNDNKTTLKADQKK